MKKENIKSNELKRLIALKAGKIDFKDVTEEDFDKITELVLGARAFNGKETGVSLDCISMFPNLKTLRIIGFDVNEDIMKILSKQMELQSITFVKCKLDEVNFEELNDRLKSVGFAECGFLNFKYPKVPYVNVYGSEVDFDNIDFKIVKRVSILNSVIKNGQSLTEFEGIESIVLDGTKIFSGDELKEEIEVSKNAKYSHKKEVELVDSER